MNKSIFFMLISLFLLACNSTKSVTSQPAEEVVEERVLAPVTVMPEPVEEVEEKYELPRYNPSFTRTADLLHTNLDLRFDWENQHVIGVAELELVPVFYDLAEVELDAKGFVINSVTMNNAKLDYSYDNSKLIVRLPRDFKRNETFRIKIDYVARPNEGPEGGSSAIQSDKGLFFINPKNEEANKPMQIWTQGETEHNSKWFPTVDKPNERCTQEIKLTVQDKFKTLSNGNLISSELNEDGTRTDYWKMDLPHAPYLFMLAIGEFAVVKENWQGKEIAYFVEPDYEAHAKEIFNHTKEMLSFFSDILDYEYPWPKLSQVVVRDYVSGAMENTTGIIYGEFVQKTDRELIDNSNDNIVAHEIFHHWFGDLVTCESWANLTLQEGFANYSEYLWNEHKYGRQRADHHRLNELRGYIQSAEGGGYHPLIHYGFNDKEDMFDGHSYNKGGLVLHMLRDYVGDEAFYSSLSKYLKDNEYTAVEVDELRMAFEDTIGEDMHWFFDQWYLGTGHPKLDVNYSYLEDSKQILVEVEQTQDPDEFVAIFQMPLEIEIISPTGKRQRHTVWLNERQQEFSFESSEKPGLVNIDPDKIQLIERTENKTDEEYAFQFKYATNFLDKYEALSRLQGKADYSDVFEKALANDYYVIQRMGVRELDLTKTPSAVENVKKLAIEGSHSSVRSAAIRSLANTGNEKFVKIAKKIIDTEQAYPVISAAMQAINKLNPDEAIIVAESLKDSENGSIFNAVSAIFAETKDPKYISFFESNFSKVDLFSSFEYFDNFYEYVKDMSPETIMGSVEKIKSISLDEAAHPYRRYGATSTLNSIKKHLSSRASSEEDIDLKTNLESHTQSIALMIAEIKSFETHPELVKRYRMFN